MRVHAARRLSFLLVLFMLLPATGRGEVRVDEERASRVKAGYLYHLTRLVSWPDDTFDSDYDSLRVGIIGDDPYDLVGLFRRSQRELRAGLHPLHIERIEAATAEADHGLVLENFQLVFFTRSAHDEALRLLDDGLPSGLLVVSEIDDFCARGGMVGFVIQDNRVRTEVNPAALEEHDLKLSAEFLQHATLVETSREGGD